MGASRQDLLVQSFYCDVAIGRGLICKQSATGMTLATAATDKLIAVANPTFDYALGDEGDFWLLGITYVKLGGTVAVGDLLTANAASKAVAGSGTFRSIGQALADGVLNDLIPVLVYPTNIEGISGITSSAAELNLLDGVTATTAELNRVDSAIAYNFLPKTAKVALAAVDTAGGVFAWTPGANVIVSRVVLDVTTASSGACTIDVGVAANATTLNDTLIDGLSLAATGIFDNVENQGTNGIAARKVTSTQSVTGSVASGASAGLVGSAYITFHEV
jgi:hypothetical protein